MILFSDVFMCDSTFLVWLSVEADFESVSLEMFASSPQASVHASYGLGH